MKYQRTNPRFTPVKLKERFKLQATLFRRFTGDKQHLLKKAAKMYGLVYCVAIGKVPHVNPKVRYE